MEAREASEAKASLLALVPLSNFSHIGWPLFAPGLGLGAPSTFYHRLRDFPKEVLFVK